MCDRHDNLRHRSSQRTRRGAPLRRKGSVYLLALGVSTLIAVIGLSALTKVRINQRQARQGTARSTAQSLAMSAVDHALAIIDATPQWRTMLRNDVESAEFKLGDGTFTWKLVDEVDGNLENDPSQLVRLRGTGRSGDAVQMYAVQLQPVKTPLACLKACLYGNGTIAWSGATVQADRWVGTNGSMNAVSAVINAPVRAVGGITGVSYGDLKEPNSEAMEMPDPVAVFDYYLINGTEISLGALPLDSSGVRVLERLALGAKCNPLGLVNAEGIYVIRCAGTQVVVRNCRVVGTIVLLDPGVGSRIEESVSWEPALPTYPALMVRGSMDIRMTAASLSESSGGSNVNFNPPGMPYDGAEDADTSDSYPSIVKGLVYMTEKLINNTNGISVEGMILVGQTTNVSGTVNVKYRRDIYHDPPPGFYHMNKVVVVPKSWQQDVR